MKEVAAFLLLALLAWLSPAWSGTLQTVYSSIAEEDCAPRERLTIGARLVQTSSDGAIFACEGPPGHRLYIVDDGTRSWYALERNGRVRSLENDIIYTFHHGNFPNVPTTGLVEWAKGPSGSVVGLIFRIAYQRQTSSGVEAASTLFVYNLEGDEPHFLGNADSNVEARRLLEGSLT